MAGISSFLFRRRGCVLIWYTVAGLFWSGHSARGAETNEWLGGDTTSSYSWFNWFIPANWTLNRVPTTADVVVVRAGIVEASPESRFARLELYSADVFGELHVDTEMHWNGGTILGSLTVTTNGVMRVQDALAKVLHTTNVLNFGKVIVTSHDWYWNSEVVWHNEPGSIFDVGILSGPLILSSAGSATMRNAGVLRVNSAGEVPWRAMLENSGSLEVQSGTLELWEGLVNIGTIAVQSNAVLALADGTFDLCSGTRTGRVQIRGDIAVANGRLCGEIDLTSGTLEGNLEIVPDAVIDVRTLGQQLLPHLADGTTVTNRGTVIIRDQEWYWGNGVLWHTAPGGRVVVLWQGVNSSLSALKPLFVNEGEFVAADDSRPQMDVQFVNNGMATLGIGEATFRRGYTQRSGSTLMSNSWFTGDITVEGGTLLGSGLIYGNITNRARLEIDTRVGGLMVRGFYVQGPTGELAATVNLPTSAYVLEIDEDSHVDGRLALLVTNSVPAAGEMALVFRARQRTGEFAQISGLGLGNGLRLEKTYEPWGLYLTAVQSPQRLKLGSLSEGAIDFDGDAERALEFQASTNLVTWETLLSTNTPTGMIRLVDPDRANYAHRFYRVLYP